MDFLLKNEASYSTLSIFTNDFDIILGKMKIKPNLFFINFEIEKKTNKQAKAKCIMTFI